MADKKTLIRAIAVILFIIACFTCCCLMAFSEKENPFTDRFEWYHGDDQTHVIVDKVTGVCYLWVNQSYEGGLSPMIDANGDPVTFRGW